MQVEGKDGDVALELSGDVSEEEIEVALEATQDTRQGLIYDIKKCIIDV